MQQLQKKLKNVPTDASQVCSSTNSSLNRDESPSVKNVKLFCNNPEGNLLQHTGGQNLVSAIVYVLDMSGKPLMPTSPRKARILIKSKEAKVVKRFPFTIQMLRVTGNNKQKVTLGIDSGYKFIGFSCITEKGELLRGEIKLENGTSKRLIEKEMYRRNRRSKLWYRKPRFNNRKIKSGWLPPSIKRKYNSHLSLIRIIEKILPIKKYIVETGNFDIQKLINPKIQGSEYQQGNLYESNLKNFVIAREHGICQFCKKEKSNDKWRFHHINGRKDCGTNRSDNIALLHKKCHKKIHRNNLVHLIKKNNEYKECSFMNIVENRLKNDLNCDITYGYITYNRIRELNLEKSHSNDAFVIAGGSFQSRCPEIHIIQKRKNNRCLQINRKGFKPSIRRKRSVYQPHDLITINGEKYNVVATHSYGRCVSVIGFENKKVLNFSTKKIESSYSYNGMILKPVKNMMAMSCWNSLEEKVS